MEAKGPRRRAPDERRDQLLNAAERVLLQRGLAATTVADVAAAAGVAKGTLYLYFASKDELLAGLRSRYLSKFTAAVGATVTGSVASPAKRLDRFVSGLFEFSVEHQELHHLLFHQAGFSEEDAFAGARRVLEQLVADGVEAGAFMVRDAHLATSFVLHGLHGTLVDALHAGAGQRRVAVVTAQELAANTLRNASGQ